MSTAQLPTSEPSKPYTVDTLTGSDQSYIDQKNETAESLKEDISSSVDKLMRRRAAQAAKDTAQAAPVKREVSPHFAAAMGRIRATLKSGSAISSVDERANPDGTDTPKTKLYSLNEHSKPTKVTEVDASKVANGLTESVDTGQSNARTTLPTPKAMPSVNTVTGGTGTNPMGNQATTYAKGMTPLNFDPHDNKFSAPGANNGQRRFFDYYSPAMSSQQDANPDYTQWNRYADAANRLGRLPTQQELAATSGAKTYNWRGRTYNQGMAALDNNFDMRAAQNPADADQMQIAYDNALTSGEGYDTWNKYVELANALGRPPTQEELVAAKNYDGTVTSMEEVSDALNYQRGKDYNHYASDRGSFMGVPTWTRQQWDNVRSDLQGTPWYAQPLTGVVDMFMGAGEGLGQAGDHFSEAINQSARGNAGGARMHLHEGLANAGRGWGNAAGVGLSALGGASALRTAGSGLIKGVPAAVRGWGNTLAATSGQGIRQGLAQTAGGAARAAGGTAMGGLGLLNTQFKSDLARQAGDMAYQTMTPDPTVTTPTVGDLALWGSQAAAVSGLPGRVIGGAWGSLPGKSVATALGDGAGMGYYMGSNAAMDPSAETGMRNRSDLRLTLGKWADPSSGLFDESGSPLLLSTEELDQLGLYIKDADRINMTVPKNLRDAYQANVNYYNRR